MPFKSEKQKAWAAEQVKKGKWSQDKFNEWSANTPANIPNKVTKPGGPTNDIRKQIQIKKIGKI